MADNDHTRSDCDKGPILEVLLNGQNAMFKKLDDITKLLSSVAVQDVEIKHLSTRVATFEGNSIRRDDFLTLKDKLKEMDDDLKDLDVGQEEIKHKLGKLQTASHVHKSGGWLDQVKTGVSIAVLTAFVLGVASFSIYMAATHYSGFDKSNKTQYAPEGK